MNLVTKTVNAIRFIGVNGVWHALRYAWARDRIERRFATELPRVDWTGPGPLLKMEASERGAQWTFAHAELQVEFLAPDLVRCDWGPGATPLPYALARADWPIVHVERMEMANCWSLQSTELGVTVCANGSLTFLDPAGATLRAEQPPERRDLAWQQRINLRPETRFYGLGERAARLNLRGGRYQLWNRDPASTYQSGDDPLYLSIPAYLALHYTGSYLVFYENSFDGSVDLGATHSQTAEVAFAGGRMRSYLMVGPPAQILARFTELTGRPALPPRWTLGFHQSRWGYRSAADVRAVAAGFRQHDLPLQAIWLDLDYMDGRRMFTWDDDRFPDPAGLAAELDEEEIRLVTVINPGIKQDPAYDVYRDGLASDHFCRLPDDKLMVAPVWPGPCAFPDFTDPAVRRWWGQFYARLFDVGIAGFWHDMNEPAVFAAWGAPTFPLVTRHQLEGRHGNHHEAHNVYGLLHAQAAFEGLRALDPQQRPFILSRSGWAGLQRYAWTWTGDTVSTWEALQQTVPTVLGLGLSGVPFVGADIGGFSGAPSADLFLRWFQMATFLPFFRTHSAIHAPAREPWTFGESTLAIVRDFLALRQQLLPYIYTLAWEATQTGAPLVRPLFWHCPKNEALWDVDNAFLLGKDLLVAPVFQPEDEVCEIMLPDGAWYSFWEDERYSGPGRIQCATSPATIPLLVRGGCVLPLAEGENNLVLHVYAGARGHESSQLYSDAGDGYGAWRLDKFDLHFETDRIDLTWRTEGEARPTYNMIHVRLHGASLDRVFKDDEPLPVSAQQFATGYFARLTMQISSTPSCQ